MIRLRAMTGDDLEWVLDLDRLTEGAPHWPVATYRKFLLVDDPGSRLRRFALVAVLDGERAGVALGQLLLDGVENLCELEWIAVATGMRQKGVGRALMEGVNAWSLEHGGLRLMLEVRAGNATAQTLYGKSGWVETGRRRDYYRNPVEDAVQMERLVGGGGRSFGEID